MAKGRILYKKIRYSKGRVYLEWIEKIDENYNGGYVDRYDPPMDSFLQAMNALAADCINICELGNMKESRIDVHTITIKYETEKEIPGVIISFKVSRDKRSGAFNINTPYHLLKSKDDNDEESNQILDEETGEKIAAIIEQAEYYRTGKKKQIDFNFSSDPPATDAGFIVKLNPDHKGLLKSGAIVALNRLVNVNTLCNTNGKSGIYHLNPANKKIKDENDKAVHAFTFKRLDNVLILQEISGIAVDEYEGNDAHTKAMDILQENFAAELAD